MPEAVEAVLRVLCCYGGYHRTDHSGSDEDTLCYGSQGEIDRRQCWHCRGCN